MPRAPRCLIPLVVFLALSQASCKLQGAYP